VHDFLCYGKGKWIPDNEYYVTGGKMDRPSMTWVVVNNVQKGNVEDGSEGDQR